MQKLENNTLQVFLNRLIEVIKMEKELGEFKNDQLDIPFIISSLYQSFEKHIDIFKEFIQDLCLYPDYNVSILDSQNDYDGLIDVDIHIQKIINGQKVISQIMITNFALHMTQDIMDIVNAHLICQITDRISNAAAMDAMQYFANSHYIKLCILQMVLGPVMNMIIGILRMSSI